MTTHPTKILQIVPCLPPYSDGVGDYARLLAQQLSTFHAIETEFVAFRPGDQTPDKVDGFKTHRLFEHSTADFLKSVPQTVDGVLLHYSNYPYLKGKLDAPFWLVDALKSLCKSRSQPLVVMYHELPTLKWKNIRILNPIQSIVSRRLAQLADAVFTDSHHFKTHLEKWTRSAVTCIPDFSTIGEPDTAQISPLANRQRRLIVFGGSARVSVYRSIGQIVETCKALAITEICDIGTPQQIDPDCFGNIAFNEMGFQTAEAVQTLLLDSVAGLMDYSRFPGDLGKSSVFAAFCAHGLMPICTTYNPSEPDGVFAGKQYAIASPELSNWSLQQCQNVANQARDWYSQHSLDINAKRFASHFSQPDTG